MTPHPGPSLVQFGKRLHEKGFVAATDGNLSSRLPAGGFLATPSGLPKAELEESALVRIDSRGTPLGAGRPSSEWPMHQAIYLAREDVGAVVHAHPPCATAMACAGVPIQKPFLSEVLISLGDVPLIPFALPSTGELARGVARGMERSNAALLANHGAVTLGEDVRSAYYRMETLEQAARIHLYACLLGGGRELPAPAAEALRLLGRDYRIASRPDSSGGGRPAAAGSEAVYVTREELVGMLKDFVRLYGRGSIG